MRAARRRFAYLATGRNSPKQIEMRPQRTPKPGREPLRELSPGLARPQPHLTDYWPPPLAGGVESAGGVVVVVVPESMLPSEAGGVVVPESMLPPSAGGVVDSVLPSEAGGVAVSLEPVPAAGAVVVSDDGAVLEPWPQAARPSVSAKALTPRIALKRNFVCDVGLVI